METQPDIIISTADLAELEFQLERSKLPSDVIRAIENELDRATIVACKDLPENVVAIGSALIGLSTGQSIKWQTQRGQQSVEIIDVSSNKR